MNKDLEFHCTAKNIVIGQIFVSKFTCNLGLVVNINKIDENFIRFEFFSSYLNQIFKSDYHKYQILFINNNNALKAIILPNGSRYFQNKCSS